MLPGQLQQEERKIRLVTPYRSLLAGPRPGSWIEMPTHACQTVSFSRQEFYGRVWRGPARKLAAELGCSDAIIGKACQSSSIP